MLRSDAGTEHHSEHPWSSVASTRSLRERTQDTRPFGRANVGGRVYGEEDSRRGARAWRCGQPMKPEEVDRQPFWEDSRVFIYAGGDSPGDPRGLSESGPHGSRRDPVRGPPTRVRFAKPARGGRDATPRVSVYKTTTPHIFRNELPTDRGAVSRY
jgi:hypothetical protein